MAAATLSMLVPGLGQFILGAYRRALVLLGLTGAIVLASGAVVLAHPSLDRRLLVSILVLDVALLGLRVFAVVDAGRSTAPLFVACARRSHRRAARRRRLPRRSQLHRARPRVRERGATRRSAFARPVPERHAPAPEPESERLPLGRPLVASPQLVTAAAPVERPWTTILLLGTDEGPGNWGARTDTIIVVALEHGTHRAVAFGIPRNLVDLRVGGRLPVFHDLINALYSYARAQPDLFPDSADPGATALKLAVSRLLGVRIDYYALANLRGFADLVDALGGVTIDVKERLHDSVTRAAWGEPKPRIDVYPGRTYHFDGHEALAYVRSRKDSDDYTRMARQRCFLSALADQVDPLSVLRNFESLARTVERNVRTDIPLDRFPGLVRLATAVDRRSTLTVTFGREYIANRRKTDNFPRPNVPRIRATVREALLHPSEAAVDGAISVAKSTC